MADHVANWLKRIVRGGAGCVPVVGGLLAEGADAWFGHLEKKPDITVIERQLRKVIARLKTLDGNQNALFEALAGTAIDENFRTPMEDLRDALDNPGDPPARIRNIIEKIQSRNVSFEDFEEKYNSEFASLHAEIDELRTRVDGQDEQIAQNTEDIDDLQTRTVPGKKIVHEKIERTIIEPPDPPTAGVSPDQAQTSPQRELPDIWNVPHNRNPNFTGRDELLESLRQSLISGAPTALTQAIAGLGGIGKTQLALEYAYRYANEYKLIWWIRSETPAQLSGDYAALVKPLGLSDEEVADQEAAVKAVRQTLEHNGNWLLIFDNAPDPGSIRDYLPHGNTGHIIITSRHQAWKGIAEPVSVQVLDADEAVEFLLKRTGRTDRPAAERLAEMLGRLPLALEQAGAYIESTACSIDDYIEFFQQNREALLARRSVNAEYPESVATTWEISFAKLSETAADLLNLCAFLAPDNIPLEMLTAGADELPESLASVVSNKMALRQCIAELLGFSLVESTAEAISIHRMVQAVVRDKLKGDRRKAIAASAVEAINAQFPFDADTDPDCWETCRTLLPHALAAAEHAEAADTSPEATGRLLNQMGIYLKTRAEFLQAKGCYERALRIIETQLEEDHPNVAALINNLGGVLRDLGDPEGAKRCFERALKIFEAQPGEDHPNVATLVNNLGRALQDLGDPEEAKKCFERALKIDEAAYEADHPNVAVRVNNLGLVLQDLGDPEGAKKCYERALRIDEAAYGADHPNVAIRVNNLGTVLQDLGDPEGAKKCYKRALKIDEAAYGADHPAIARDVNNLGGVLFDQGDIHGALEHAERALRIREARLGPDHPDTKHSRQNVEFVRKKL
ncbi:MAG: FxSxx-COOH system tetratricopeptide repeat protein [Phycisphaerae bacterium]|jgi:tetratricopeptide (TPR) repeat protein|nr:FxSxx-COOH system tetratricopeptide repeat protein [Phycisphaerae bacterium]